MQRVSLLQENKCQHQLIRADLQWYPFCICIQPLVDFPRGSRDCSFGFPKQYQSLLGYACLQSLFSSLSLFGPSFDWDHSWVFTPLSFQLAIQLSLTAPIFNTQIMCYSNLDSTPPFGQNICTLWSSHNVDVFLGDCVNVSVILVECRVDIATATSCH